MGMMSVGRTESPTLAPQEWGTRLYLAQEHDSFEETAQQLVQQIVKKDPCIGVEPGVRRRKGS